MTISWGLLWYDGDPKRPLQDKIGQAARRYRDKHGRWPDTCYVHPGAVPANVDPAPVAGGLTGIRVVTAPNILQGHLWLGYEGEA